MDDSPKHPIAKDTSPKTERAKRCFVLMPFDPSFDELYKRIETLLTHLGMYCWRADKVSMSGDVMTKVLEDIKKADIVIADLTGRNPNVFYEVGHAHARRAPASVVLIAQKDDDVPFDLRALRYIRYDNNQQGRKELTEQLAEFVREGISDTGGLFETISGSAERTRRIVADLAALLLNDSAFIKQLSIRIQAGLSSLSIADDEKPKLVQERELLQKLINRGAMVKIILCPPTGRLVTRSRDFTYLGARYQRLMTLLKEESRKGGDLVLPLETCKMALSPFRGDNLMILGKRLYYEGIKMSLRGGFDLTTRVTHAGPVAARVRAFDQLFEEATQYTLKYWPANQGRTRAEKLRHAVLCGIRNAYQEFSDGRR